MILHEWEVWRTYSTYFVEPVPDLDAAAQAMVRSGLVSYAFLRDGRFWWKREDALKSGTVIVALHPNRRQGDITFVSQMPAGFPGEAAWQSAYLRFMEVRQFGEDIGLPSNYVRGFVGQCVLNSPGHEVTVYPIITLYETGVMLVEMRVIGPKRGVALRELVDGFVNLSQRAFEKLLVPPSLHLLTLQLIYAERHRWPPLKRIQLTGLERNYRKYVHSITTTRRGGDFEHTLAPLWNISDSAARAIPEPTRQCAAMYMGFTISHLAHALFGATAVAISDLRTGFPFIIRGQKKPRELGSFWTARPHTHVIRHSGQRDTASENEKAFGDAYGWILAGLVKDDPETGRKYLPSTARPFDDFGAYVASQGTLWVWSNTGREQQEERQDPNRGHLIYENQVRAEALDYGYMVYRRLAEVAHRLGDPEAVLKAQQNLLDLEMRLLHTSVYGETTDLLIQGWDLMGVNRLRDLTTDALSVRAAATALVTERAARNWSSILTIAFGLLAAPPLASGVILPLWNLLGIRKPSDGDAQELLSVVVGLLFVLVVLLLAWLFWPRRSRSSS